MILSTSLVVQYYDLFIIVHHNNSSYLFFIFYLCSVSSGGTRGGAQGARPPALFLDQTEARRAEKIFCDRAPHLSQVLDQALISFF